MSDEKKVLDLQEARRRRAYEAGRKASDDDAFVFEHYEYSDTVGFLDGDEHVTFLIDDIHGLVMSRADAKKLGGDLVKASKTRLPVEKDGA